MAANTLPSGIGDLFQLAERVKEGVAVHGPWMLRNSVTAEEIGASIESAQAAEGDFARARASKAGAAKDFAEADEELTSWLAKARLVVMLAYGNKWSQSWIAAGFTHRGTNVPKRVGPRMELVRRLTDFLAENPQYEVPFASVTATAADAMKDKITTADQLVRRTTTEASEKKRARDAAEKKLRRKMRTVRLFVSCMIKKNDPRWQAFGLKVPRPDDRASLVSYSVAHAEPMEVEFGSSSAAGSVDTVAA